MAQVNWTRANNTGNVPSYSDGGPNDSETQTKIIESIQEEQNRVYKQDQQLLGSLGRPIREDPREDEDKESIGGFRAAQEQANADIENQY